MKPSKTFGLLKKNKKKIIVIVLIEFLFLFLLFISSGFVFQKLTNKYESLNQLSFGLEGQTKEEMMEVEGNLTELNSILNEMLYWVVFLSIFALVFSSLVLSLTSLMCFRFLKKKKFSFKYLGKYSILFLIWISVIFLLTKISGIFRGNLEIVFLGCLLVLSLYFAMTAFSVLLFTDNLKKAIKSVYLKGIKEFSELFFVYFLGILILTGIGFLFTYLSRFYEYTALFGVVLFLFSFVILRVKFLEKMRETGFEPA